MQILSIIRIVGLLVALFSSTIDRKSTRLNSSH